MNWHTFTSDMRSDLGRWWPVKFIGVCVLACVSIYALILLGLLAGVAWS